MLNNQTKRVMSYKDEVRLVRDLVSVKGVIHTYSNDLRVDSRRVCLKSGRYGFSKKEAIKKCECCGHEISQITISGEDFYTNIIKELEESGVIGWKLRVGKTSSTSWNAIGILHADMYIGIYKHFDI
jgi:hypothetical protein